MKYQPRTARRSAKKFALGLGCASQAIWSNDRGVAAIEFGIFAVFLSFALVNVADVSTYIYQRMQAENVTQVAAQAAYVSCDTSHLPAISNCPGLAAAVQTAVQSSSL